MLDLKMLELGGTVYLYSKLSRSWVPGEGRTSTVLPLSSQSRIAAIRPAASDFYAKYVTRSVAHQRMTCCAWAT